jgi:hypothetical protein
MDYRDLLVIPGLALIGVAGALAGWGSVLVIPLPWLLLAGLADGLAVVAAILAMMAALDRRPAPVPRWTVTARAVPPLPPAEAPPLTGTVLPRSIGPPR